MEKFTKKELETAFHVMEKIVEQALEEHNDNYFIAASAESMLFKMLRKIEKEEYEKFKKEICL